MLLIGGVVLLIGDVVLLIGDVVLLIVGGVVGWRCGVIDSGVVLLMVRWCC